MCDDTRNSCNRRRMGSGSLVGVLGNVWLLNRQREPAKKASFTIYCLKNSGARKKKRLFTVLNHGRISIWKVEGLERSSHLRHKLKILVLHLWCSGINSYLLHSNRFYSPGGDSGAKLTGMTIKRGKIKTHKSPNETQKSPWTKIKPERVTCQKTELFFFFKKEIGWIRISDVQCPLVRHQTSNSRLRRLDIRYRTSNRSPMSDVWFLMSDVQCPISDVWFPMFDVRCLMRDA